MHEAGERPKGKIIPPTGGTEETKLKCRYFPACGELLRSNNNGNKHR